MTTQAPVVWAQRKSSVYFTVNVPDVKDEKIVLTETTLTFTGTSNGKAYSADLLFFGELDPKAEVSHTPLSLLPTPLLSLPASSTLISLHSQLPLNPLRLSHTPYNTTPIPHNPTHTLTHPTTPFSQESKFEVKPRCIQFHINKKEGDVWWPRLLKDKVKEKNQVQVDWSRYVDEDEADGKGFGDMQFGGGAQGFGGEDFDGMG